MKHLKTQFHRLVSLSLALLMLWVSLRQTAAATCVNSGCAVIGSRIVSVSTQRSVLQNALLGQLLGTSVNLTGLEWQNVAAAQITALDFFNALQARAGVASPQDALTANVKLVDVIDAAISAVQTKGNTAAVSAFSLRPSVAGLAGAIHLRTYTVTGYVYADTNRNAFRDTAEVGSGLTLYAKPVPATAPSGPATQVAAVDPSTGLFTFTGLSAGTNTIVIDDSATASDITPSLPTA